MKTKAERWAKIIENATDSTKITKYYNKLESVYKKQVKTTYDAASRYLSKANSIKISKDSKKDKDLKAKIQSKDSSLFTKDGNLKSYKTLIKQYGEKTAEAIQNYQDYYDKYQSAIDSYIEACESLYNAPIEEASAKIELLAKDLELLDAKLENTTVDGYNDANALIDKQVTNQKNQEKANKVAFNDSETNLNKAKKPFDVETQKDLKKFSDLTSKKERQAVLDAVKAGQEIDITLFKEGSKGYKKALAYNTALQARNDAEQEYQLAVQETVKIEREAEKQKFDNIESYYEKRISLYDHNMQNLDNRISEIESSGANVNKSYYESQKKINNDIKKMYEEEKTKLEEQLSSITQGTEEWYEAKDEIQECENAISDCVKTTYELNNAIKDLHFQMFEDISDEIQRIINEQEFLQSLFEHEDSVSTETGNFTDAGIARLGSISTQYYATKEDNTNNSAILNELNRMIKSGEKYSKLLEFEFTSTDDLIDKRNEYIDIVQDGYKQQYDYATKLADLEKEKYQAELDMLRDLIDKKLEAIDAEKDLYDYQNKVDSQVKDIDTIQRQISAYQGDSSQEGMARLQSLQKELAEKEQSLRETEQEKAFQDQKDLLEGLFKEAKEYTAKKLEDFQGLVKEALGTANGSLSDIDEFLSQIATDNGYTIQTDGKDGNKIFKLEEGEKSLSDSIQSLIKTIEKDVESRSGTDKGDTAKDTTNANGGSNSNDKFAVEIGGETYHTGFTPSSQIPVTDLTSPVGNRIVEEVPLQLVELKGYSQGGVVSADDIEKQVKANGDKVLISANPGEGLLTPIQTELFSDFVNNGLQDLVSATDMLKPLIDLPKMPNIQPVRNSNQVVQIDNITLPNVTNYDEFKTQMFRDMQSDRKFEGMIQDMTVNRLSGGNSLSKYRHRF